MSRLGGKIALITGGSSEIGLATAKEFVSEGTYVFITGRRERELAQAAQEIQRNITGIRSDVSILSDVNRPFLASDDSSYMTGAELFVDGGFAQV